MRASIIAVVVSLLFGAGVAFGKKPAPQRVRLYRALVALGVPKVIARPFLKKGKPKAKACEKNPSLFTRGHVHFVVDPNAKSVGTWTSLAVVTPSFGPLMKRIYRARFRPLADHQAGAPRVFQKRNVKVIHYPTKAMAGDVFGAVSRCTGASLATVNDRYEVVIISMEPQQPQQSQQSQQSQH